MELKLTLLLVGAILFSTGCSDDRAKDQAPSLKSVESVAPAGRLGTSIVPTSYKVELKIDPTRASFSGRTTINITLKEPSNHIWVHGKNLEVSEVYLVDNNSNRIDATYEERLESGVALVALDRTAESGQASLRFVYEAPFNLAGNALFKVVRGSESYAVTQFQPIAARQVFPGFDEPVFKVPFDLEVVARAGDVVVTTTPEASQRSEGNKFVRHIFERTRPLPTYLLAFAVGPYDVVDFGMLPPNSVRNREIPLRGIAAKGLGVRMTYALRNTDGILSKLEEYFGSPYPYKKLDLIAVPEGFGGAMENVGAITYDEYLILMDEDAPLDQRRSFMATHAHELAHMWFGDLVTPGWWTDLWLNESFATWLSYKIAQAHWPEGEFDQQTLKGALGAMSNDSLASARKIREPINHNDKIAEAFDGITYQKGGGVLAMLERYAGALQFQAGIRHHMDRYADSTVMAEGFMESLVQGSELGEIEPIFQSFISQPGVPLLSVTLNCSEGKNPNLAVQQSRYAPLGSSIDPDASLWQIPICIRVSRGGVFTSNCTLLVEKEMQIDLGDDSCPDYVHPNADGAGYYRFSLDESGWHSLIENAENLTAAEALSLADSLDAAFSSGEVSSESYLYGLAVLVNHEDWGVVDAATSYFEGVTNIIEANRLGVLEEAFRGIVGPRFRALDPDQDTQSRLLYRRLLRFMIVMAKDPSLRGPLAEQAAEVIGLDGDPDPASAPADQLETILSVGVQDMGEPFFNLLMKQATESQDPAFREAATGALARVENPVLVRKLQSAVLTGRFKGTEMVGIVFRQMARVKTTELTYAFVIENADTLIEMVPETFRSSTFPALGNFLCSNEQANGWHDFITLHGDQLPGYERSLAQATESVRLCAALRDRSASDLLVAAGRYAGG